MAAKKETGPRCPDNNETLPESYRQAAPQSSRIADSGLADYSAESCWISRRCGYGCTFIDDCRLAGPLPVHDDQPCTGQFTEAGFAAHCHGDAA